MLVKYILRCITWFRGILTDIWFDSWSTPREGRGCTRFEITVLTFIANYRCTIDILHEIEDFVGETELKYQIPNKFV